MPRRLGTVPLIKHASWEADLSTPPGTRTTKASAQHRAPTQPCDTALASACAGLGAQSKQGGSRLLASTLLSRDRQIGGAVRCRTGVPRALAVMFSVCSAWKSQ